MKRKLFLLLLVFPSIAKASDSVESPKVSHEGGEDLLIYHSDAFFPGQTTRNSSAEENEGENDDGENENESEGGNASQSQHSGQARTLFPDLIDVIVEDRRPGPKLTPLQSQSAGVESAPIAGAVSIVMTGDQTEHMTGQLQLRDAPTIGLRTVPHTGHRRKSLPRVFKRRTATSPQSTAMNTTAPSKFVPFSYSIRKSAKIRKPVLKTHTGFAYDGYGHDVSAKQRLDGATEQIGVLSAVHRESKSRSFTEQNMPPHPTGYRVADLKSPGLGSIVPTTLSMSYVGQGLNGMFSQHSSLQTSRLPHGGGYHQTPYRAVEPLTTVATPTFAGQDPLDLSSQTESLNNPGGDNLNGLLHRTPAHHHMHESPVPTFWLGEPGVLPPTLGPPLVVTMEAPAEKHEVMPFPDRAAEPIFLPATTARSYNSGPVHAVPLSVFPTDRVSSNTASYSPIFHGSSYGQNLQSIPQSSPEQHSPSARDSFPAHEKPSYPLSTKVDQTLRPVQSETPLRVWPKPSHNHVYSEVASYPSATRSFHPASCCQGLSSHPAGFVSQNELSAPPPGRQPTPLMPNGQNGVLVDQNWPKCAQAARVPFCLTDNAYPLAEIIAYKQKYLEKYGLLHPRLSWRVKPVSASRTDFDGMGQPPNDASDLYQYRLTKHLTGACSSSTHISMDLLRSTNHHGRFKVIVHWPDEYQLVFVETCDRNNACGYVTSHTSSSCVQQYTLKELMVYTPEFGIHLDQMNVPSGCRCSVLSPLQQTDPSDFSSGMSPAHWSVSSEISRNTGI